MKLAQLRRSLTLRVTLVFVLIVALVSAGLGMHLYRSFVAEIERRDDILLLGKLRQIQQLLGNAGTLDIIRERPQYFRDTMSGQENSLVRIVRADGTRLIDVNPNGETVAHPVPVAVDAPVTDSAIVSWTSRDGYPARVVAASARIGDPAQMADISVARVYGDRTAMFAAYRWQIVVSVAVSALVAALLSSVMLLRGLRPLRNIAAHAALVRPGKLEQQLEARGAPTELLPLIHALNAMLARLQEGYARLSQFSADLAHEFRTPVTNLLGQSQVMLARPRSAQDYEQLVSSNVEELERLSRMIDSMLFLARAQQDEMVLVKQVLPVQDEFARLADFFEGLAEERELALACHGSGNVTAEPQLLRRALGNLLSNAIRHAAPGSTILLRSHATNEGVELSVSNLGPAIPARHLPHLFERFYRADPARSDSAASTGLGLAIVTAIMQLHGGSATVASDAAATTFTLVFPA
ncbi:heavy metal sensor histidine kinase [Janthinobacterium sp. YR213]|uniref:heavy metal sensor histidine kinase n=1 Tax=Janthinobacterium sp. YR213 TaxID=1881027 RepID=UPI000885635F|nr:heavy metal sensor histidine kinase [Janthinobacterium sp. YR213]SDI04379.1 two-component system, OmpR family, heavy metal sensor histidine kinase CusS [Janthinobacterium sp. YR213]